MGMWAVSVLCGQGVKSHLTTSFIKVIGFKSCLDPCMKQARPNDSLSDMENSKLGAWVSWNGQDYQLILVPLMYR